MNEPPITRWLQRSADGDEEATERVAEWAYGELERLADARMRRQFGRTEVTLEPAALVNETFLKLLRHPIGFANRRHFFAFVSQVMLRVLIDYRRGRVAGKRSVDRVAIELEGLAADGGPTPIDAIAAEETMARLERHDARKAEVARLRAFWGLSVDEVAELLGVSKPTVIRDWRFVRNWLADEFGLAASG